MVESPTSISIAIIQFVVRRHPFSASEVAIHCAAARFQRRSIIEITFEIRSLRIVISGDVDTVLFLFWTPPTPDDILEKILLVRH
jgi:hypothetical protein